MVVPVGVDSQKMKLVVRNDENNYNISEHGDFSFVPMLKNKS